MNNLIQRSITGAIFAFVVLGSIIWDPYAQAIVFSVFMVLGLLEFYNLFSKHSFVQVSKEIGIFIGLFIFSLLVGVSLEWLPQISILFISPKKTWEGTVGGVIFTLVLGYIIGAYINEGDELFWIISALIIAPCAIFGDLLESLFKRSLDIKDSGKILPGHGGILDRFDAALFAIPFFYCWAMVYDYF